MSKENEINTFNFGIKQKAFIVLMGGFLSPHKGMWEVSFTGNKRKYYFKSYRSAELFLEINRKPRKNKTSQIVQEASKNG